MFQRRVLLDNDEEDSAAHPRKEATSPPPAGLSRDFMSRSPSASPFVCLIPNCADRDSVARFQKAESGWPSESLALLLVCLSICSGLQKTSTPPLEFLSKYASRRPSRRKQRRGGGCCCCCCRTKGVRAVHVSVWDFWTLVINGRLRYISIPALPKQSAARHLLSHTRARTHLLAGAACDS